MNLAKFLRIPFLTEHFRWLLLEVIFPRVLTLHNLKNNLLFSCEARVSLEYSISLESFASIIMTYLKRTMNEYFRTELQDDWKKIRPKCLIFSHDYGGRGLTYDLFLLLFIFFCYFCFNIFHIFILFILVLFSFYFYFVHFHYLIFLVVFFFFFFFFIKIFFNFF